MTTKLGNFCIVNELTVDNLQVTGHAQLAESAEFKLPSSGANAHDHRLATNHSIVYFKYAFEIAIAKFTTTNTSTKVKITFDDPHHFTGGDNGVKMAFTGKPTGTNLRGLTAVDFAGKKDIDTWSNALGNDELEFDASVAATSTGDIAAGEMKGVVLIYKYLDLAGGDASWETAFDQAPGAKHQ